MTLTELIRSHIPGTQAEVARRIGISRSYLAEILSGSKQPGRKTIQKIDDATAGRVPASMWFGQGIEHPSCINPAPSAAPQQGNEVADA